MLTPEQLEARKGKITSSIAAACLGLHPYITPLQAKQRILGLGEHSSTKATERGDTLEDLVLGYPAEKLSLYWQRSEFRVHPEHQWAADSCDSVYSRIDAYPKEGIFDAVPIAIGEGKTAALGPSLDYGEEGTDQVPIHVLIQCHWHLIHWPEVDICYVPVLVGGYQFEFRLYKVDRDVEVEQRMLESLGKWHHKHIVLNEDPEPTSDDLSYLTRKYPQNLEPMEYASAGGELDQLARAYMLAKREAESSKATCSGLRAKLQVAIGAREGFDSEEWRATYRNNKPSEKVDYEQLANFLLDSHCNEEQRAAMRCKFASTVPGARVLRVDMKRAK